MLIITRLHRSDAMRMNDDSTLNVYNCLQQSRYRKDSNSSSDYVDMTGGMLSNTTLPRVVSWGNGTDNSSSSDESVSVPLSERLKRNVSKKLKEARKKFVKLGRAKIESPPVNEPMLHKKFEIYESVPDLSCKEVLLDTTVEEPEYMEKTNDDYDSEGIVVDNGEPMVVEKNETVIDATEAIMGKLAVVSINDETSNFQGNFGTTSTKSTNSYENMVVEVRSPQSTTEADCDACERPDHTVLTTTTQGNDDIVYESKVVLETNIYRLSNNAVNLNDDIKKLTQAEDERGLSTWTDNNRRWSIIEKDFHNASPSDCENVSHKPAARLNVEPGDPMYNYYRNQAMRESEHLKLSRGIPMIMKIFLSIEKSQVIMSELDKLGWQYNISGKWVKILAPAIVDTGAEVAIAASKFFDIFRETPTKNLRISGLFWDNSERQFKHRVVHAHLHKCGMLEIIECQKLPQLKLNSENRRLAEEQLGIGDVSSKNIKLYDNSEVSILIPVTVARFTQIEPTSIGLKNPVSSPGMLISKSDIGINYIVHGSVGVCEEDFEGPPDTWPVFKTDMNSYNSTRNSLSTTQ